MSNISSLINQLAKKAGIDVSDKALIDLLSNAELSKIAVPEGLTQKLDEGLLSIEAAVDNHPKIRAKYMAETFNAVDAKLDKMIQALGLTDEELIDFNETKGTYKRIEKLSELAKAKVSEAGKGDSKGKGSDPEEVKLLKDKVNQLNAELATAKKAVTEKESEFETIRKKDRMDFIMNRQIASRKSTLDELPEEVKLTSYNTLLQKKLAANGIKIDTSETGELVLLTADGSNYVDKNHKKVSFTDLLDELEAENKLIVATPQPPSGGAGAGANGGGTRFPQNGNGSEKELPKAAANVLSRIISANEAGNAAN